MSCPNGIRYATDMKHWAIQVDVEGDQVCRLETGCLSGVPNIADYREENTRSNNTFNFVPWFRQSRVFLVWRN